MDIDSLFNCFEECDNNEPKNNVNRIETLSQVSSQKRKNEDNYFKDPKQSKLMYNPLQDPDINVSKLDPGINIHVITKDEDCLHEVAVPPNQRFPNLVSSEEPPVRTFKFELDTFQKKAILCIENKQSVLVSAHTSAGKTVVAEYAIALALKSKQRVIYTTPIKALSNQKYREMLHEFKDVGIMTGDVTIDPMASCLIMTTEILRSMLLRGSEITKEVGWVIFDEIHYMRDKTRGVVWEETIILLPKNVRYVFLSATIPNAGQFAEWICHLHQQPCHVVYTEYRPTPLQHYVFPTNATDMYLVVDEKGKLQRSNFEKAMVNLHSQPLLPKHAKENEKIKNPPTTADDTKNVFNVVKYLMSKDLAPLIVFSFSKSACELYAQNLSRLNFNTEREQKLVKEVFNNAIDVLNDNEKQLPQIVRMLPLLVKGIAFHHSGLLPIIKEVVEILFGEGLIKTLFATETFAMGLNMPARTVVFTSIEKYDGQQLRKITSGEYIQMSGRAGRRGLDTNGSVVLILNEKLSPDTATQLMTGKAAPLISAFHITYNMVLNLMRLEEINPEYMIGKSFMMFQTNARLLELRRTLKVKQKKFTAIHINNEDFVASYSSTATELESVHEQIREHVLQSDCIVDFLNRGRFVKIKVDDSIYDWGIIMGCEGHQRDNSDITIRVLLHVQNDMSGSILPKPNYSRKKGKVAIYPISYKYIYQLSILEANINLNLKHKILAKAYLKKLNELKELYPNGLSLINPVRDMGIENEHIEGLIKKAQELEKLLSLNPIFHKDKEALLKNFNRKEELSVEISDILNEIKQLQYLTSMDELQKRKNVLKMLGYCNDIEVINMKGRVACELSCVNELLISEMIFNGIFNELSADYCVALLSGFVCEEKFQISDISYDRMIYRAINQTEEIANTIATASVECKLIESKENYFKESFHPHLVEIVLAWCRGASFLDICKMTTIYEGSIIRYLRLLEEVLKQACRAATNVGNIDLENRFSEGIRLLKRGVVFTGSLYL